MIITVEDILKHKPCGDWTEERLRKYGDRLSLTEILSLKSVSVEDKIWCVTRFLPDNVNRAFAIWCARQCKCDTPEVNNYIDVIEKHYIDKAATEEEMKAADRAACGAVCWYACWAVDWTAYMAAHMAAYKASDRAVCWASYWTAYRSVCWASYRDAERSNQLDKLKELVATGE